MVSDSVVEEGVEEGVEEEGSVGEDLANTSRGAMGLVAEARKPALRVMMEEDFMATDCILETMGEWWLK